MAEGVIFSILDYIIMAVTMVASVLIGAYFRFTGGKQKTNEEYLLADRNMSIFPVAISLMASFVSAITILGGAAETYYFGMQFAAINISIAFVMPVSGYFYLPVFFGLQRTSTYEYLELRFGPQLRMLASLTYTLQMLLYNGIVLYAPAILLESVTDLDRLISVLVVGLTCTFYSALGGMKAVLFTDILQSFLMLVAVVSIVVFASIQLGGFDQIFVIAKENGRLDFSNFSLDPTVRHTWWSLLIGGFFTNMSLYAVNHTQVQRLLTVSTLSRSRQSLFWCWPVIVTLCSITYICGLAIFAVYRECDPLTVGSITASDQIMLYYVVNAMRDVPGLAGLFVAGIFSASLSTVSSSCNALAGVFFKDYISRWFNISPNRAIWITKLTTCGVGLVFLALAFLAEHLGGLLQAALTIFGAVGGPLLGVFTLGMFTTFANERGVSLALLTGMAMTMWMSFGGPRPTTPTLPVGVEGCAHNVTLPAPTPDVDDTHYFYLYRISYMWTSMMGFLWVTIVGSVISLLWRQKHPWEKVEKGRPDHALFTPLLAKYLKKKMEENTFQITD